MPEILSLKEKTIHGSEMFPLSVYSYDRGYTKHILDCHWHDEMEFIYLKQGKAEFQVEGTKIEVNSGQAVFINSGLLHTGISLELSHCIYYAVVFKSCMLLSSNYDVCQSEYIDPIIKKEYFLSYFIAGSSQWENDIIFNLSDLVNYYFRKPYGYEFAIKACLFKIFSCMILNCRNELPADRISVQNNYRSKRIKDVLKFIYENYDSKIKVDDLSAISNMSTDYFSRFFKSMTGKSPVDYINSYRINQACRLLVNSDKNISDIAGEAGFDNFSYFIRKFKELKGCTPANFRKIRASCSVKQN